MLAVRYLLEGVFCEGLAVGIAVAGEWSGTTVLQVLVLLLLGWSVGGIGLVMLAEKRRGRADA